MPSVTRTGFPEAFLSRLGRIYPGSASASLLKALAAARRTSFRLNPLRAGATELRKALEEAGLKAETLPWLPGAYLLQAGRLRDLEALPLYEKGGIYVQNLSSMLPPLVLGPRPGERVLDLAAAPGGKTCQMAALMEGRGEIVAVEKDEVRFQKLQATLVRQGASLVRPLRGDGALHARGSPLGFDRVLLDAPCTAEGRFDPNQPSTFGYWSEKKIRENAKLQRRLLAAGLEALKPGGRLVYSTCTFAPEENEEVLQSALDRFPGLLSLETILLRPPDVRPGLLEWEGKNFDPGMGKALRLLPGAGREGFFIALIRKREGGEA